MSLVSMEKRGQFYLIAAIVIIGIIVSLGAVYNVARTPDEDVTLYDLSKEINYEGAQVLDTGVFNGLTPDQIKNNLTQLGDYYAQVSPQTDLLFIYGDDSMMNFYLYNNTRVGDIGISLGGSISEKPLNKIKRYSWTSPVPSKKVEVTITPDANYTFNLKSGQNFFIILKKEKGDEKFIAVPEK